MRLKQKGNSNDKIDWKIIHDSIFRLGLTCRANKHHVYEVSALQRKCKGWKGRQKHVLERWKVARKAKVFQKENAVCVSTVEASQLIVILLEMILD